MLFQYVCKSYLHPGQNSSWRIPSLIRSSGTLSSILSFIHLQLRHTLIHAVLHSALGLRCLCDILPLFVLLSKIQLRFRSILLQGQIVRGQSETNASFIRCSGTLLTMLPFIHYFRSPNYISSSRTLSCMLPFIHSFVMPFIHLTLHLFRHSFNWSHSCVLHFFGPSLGPSLIRISFIRSSDTLPSMLAYIHSFSSSRIIHSVPYSFGLSII